MSCLYVNVKICAIKLEIPWLKLNFDKYLYMLIAIPLH